jgi:2',3'-cyclic-nucleotide 2'-phosphodiesterase (5'-nucleotidase family)
MRSASRGPAVLVPALLVFVQVALASCAIAPPPPPAALPDETAATSTARAPDAPRNLHVLFTTDEHGWLLPLKDEKEGVQRGGIVALYERFTKNEGYAPGQGARDAGYVLLSAGDNWTGPYETTVLEGAPMVAAMSEMGYAASAVGNHEFDFGVRTLAERAKAARFPLLAANLVELASGNLPSWAKAFTIVEVGGTKLGVIGLTNVDSPVTSDPRHMTGLKFRGYVETLDEWAPKVKAAGADELVVLLHDSLSLAPELMPTFRKHHVRLVAFGHHHVAGEMIDDNGTPDVDDDIVICNAGAYMRSYCRADLVFQGAKMTSRAVKLTTVEAPLGTVVEGNATLMTIVTEAEKSANQIGGEVLVENARLLKRGVDGPLGQMIVDAWLEALPYAQVAVTNAGGLRQDLPAGPVRMRDVVSVLPFNNYLLVVDLTGAQLKEVLANEESVVSGLKFTYTVDAGKPGRVIQAVVGRDGKPIADDAKLKVVINDFMFRGGDRYKFQTYDAEPEETAIDWREPVLRALRDMGKAGKKLDVTADDRATKTP